MSNTTTAGVKGGIFAKYSTFDGKKYLRMLVTKKECPLTHSERLVLSYRVYRARDLKPLSNAKIARVLRLDRHTVSKAVKSLDSQGVYVDDPVSAKPEWFAKPHRDGAPRCYRHYLVESGLTKLENTLYWMMWSLTKTRTIVQSKSGLAALTNYSRFRVIAAIKKLVTKGFIKVTGKKITLLDPPTLDYWQDRGRRVAKPLVETTSEPVLSEDWVEVLVNFRYETACSSDKGYLVEMIEKRVSLMKKATISITDIQDYWQIVLRLVPDNEKAWNFACFKFEDVLKDALRIHAEKGHAKTCIALLIHLTKQQLSQPPALLW